MDLDELLAMLDLESPDQFEYFENFADLVEADEEIPEDLLYELFEETDGRTVSGLIGNYFEEILSFLPDDSTEMYLLLENIRNTLMGLIRTKDDENNLLHFSVELARFRDWYAEEGKVVCTDLDTRDETFLSVRDAIVTARLAKLSREEYEFDFTQALDYDIEEYIVDLSDFDDEDDPDGESGSSAQDYDAYDDIDDY